MEQSLCLDLARRAGMRAAEAESSSGRLGSPEPERYYHAVVEPAIARGLLDRRQQELWASRCCGGEAAADLRVRIFLVGWAEGARSREAADRAAVLGHPGGPPPDQLRHSLGAA